MYDVILHLYLIFVMSFGRNLDVYLPCLNGSCSQGTITFDEVIKVLYPHANAQEYKIMYEATKEAEVVKADVLGIQKLFDSLDHEFTGRASRKGMCVLSLYWYAKLRHSYIMPYSSCVSIAL